MTTINERLAEMRARLTADAEKCFSPERHTHFDQEDRANLLAAVEAVVEVHKPLHALDVGTRPAHHTNVCIGCGTDDGNWQVWPCPTIRSITTALGVTP